MFQAIYSRFNGRSPEELIALAGKNIRHGLARFGSVERARRNADRAFDRRWGTDTSAGVSVHDLGFDRARIDHCRRYDPSSEAMLHDPVAMLALDPATYDFVDYGAGKGRVMMLALAMGFRSVAGVELSARLCGVARANLERFAARNPEMSAAQVIQADATAFTPRGTRLLTYFYNPFDALVMAGVRDRLEAALRDGTRCVRVIYANPEHAHVFAAPGWRAGPARKGIATFVAEAPEA